MDQILLIIVVVFKYIENNEFNKGREINLTLEYFKKDDLQLRFTIQECCVRNHSKMVERKIETSPLLKISYNSTIY